MSIFNQIEEDKKIYKSNNFFIIKDQYPVSPGHLLIISNEEKINYFELSTIEKTELTELIDIAKDLIEKELNPDGYNIGMNCGEHAGQTIMHFHCHIIPRYKNDMENPIGGIRNTIPGKGEY